MLAALINNFILLKQWIKCLIWWCVIWNVSLVVMNPHIYHVHLHFTYFLLASLNSWFSGLQTPLSSTSVHFSTCSWFSYSLSHLKKMYVHFLSKKKKKIIKHFVSFLACSLLSICTLSSTCWSHLSWLGLIELWMN